VPKKSHYACSACGTVQDVLTTIKATGKTGPMAAYAVQGYAPKRDEAGKPYGGRFFAAYGAAHAQQYDAAFAEWEARKDADLKDYWPLTVRQAYYQAVSRGVIANNLNEYQRVSRALTTLRREGFVSWAAYEDRSRRTVEKRGVSDLSVFVQAQLESFLDWRYYHRCRVQEQTNYVEVSVEKDALSSIFEEAVWPYCVRLNVVRGQVSADLINKMARRFKAAERKEQRPLLLHFGDFDPTGVQIPQAIENALREHHGVEVHVIRAALDPDQIRRFKLPASIDAAKQTDPNYRRFVEVYDDAKPVELDALHPSNLTRLIKEHLQAFFDMASFEEQMELEERERSELKAMRRTVMDFMRREFPAIAGGAH